MRFYNDPVGRIAFDQTNSEFTNNSKKMLPAPLQIGINVVYYHTVSLSTFALSWDISLTACGYKASTDPWLCIGILTEI